MRQDQRREDQTMPDATRTSDRDAMAPNWSEHNTAVESDAADVSAAHPGCANAACGPISGDGPWIF
jgi:hypothetical protein